MRPALRGCMASHRSSWCSRRPAPLCCLTHDISGQRLDVADGGCTHSLAAMNSYVGHTHTSGGAVSRRCQSMQQSTALYGTACARRRCLVRPASASSARGDNAPSAPWPCTRLHMQWRRHSQPDSARYSSSFIYFVNIFQRLAGNCSDVAQVFAHCSSHKAGLLQIVGGMFQLFLSFFVSEDFFALHARLQSLLIMHACTWQELLVVVHCARSLRESKQWQDCRAARFSQLCRRVACASYECRVAKKPHQQSGCLCLHCLSCLASSFLLGFTMSQFAVLFLQLHQFLLNGSLHLSRWLKWRAGGFSAKTATFCLSMHCTLSRSRVACLGAAAVHTMYATFANMDIKR